MYDDGFTFEKYTNEFCNDVPMNLNPYDLHTEPILTDIEYGCISTWIPLDDMQCKYVNGTILCEVRDYRVFIEFPVINQVPLKMTLASLVKDMSNMSEQISYEDRLIKLIDWVIISKKRRIDTSHNLNPLKSFQNIDTETQRALSITAGHPAESNVATNSAPPDARRDTGRGRRKQIRRILGEVENDGYFIISYFVEDDAIPVFPTTSDVTSTPQFNVDDIDFIAPFDYKDPFT
ncbi:hypothetical protein CTI12_AA099730 [Artemisia annua]|uniref:Spt20-like SEP domain-containing protein n=1 Tax=Artemisia annua TaxID=35608 RepID=A0A2U1PXW2_ARTAN|nr:hypothetical protein CTI12_AA099730 [Artemisia annua]